MIADGGAASAVVVLGCGTIGCLVGQRLVASGHGVIGVRRQPDAVATAFPVIAGDIASAAIYDRLGSPTAALLAANPGLRRGGDNRLAEAARLARACWPLARLVYTGTTSVYADAGGAGVAEDGALADDPAARALLAIEQAVLGSTVVGAAADGSALVLRATALVGPTRTHATGRLRAGDWTVRGALDRPFSWLHEDDLADLCVAALDGAFGSGVLNAAAPERGTVGDYYRGLARAAGLVGEPHGDGAALPARWIDAGRLWAMCPGRRWRHFLDGRSSPCDSIISNPPAISR